MEDSLSPITVRFFGPFSVTKKDGNVVNWKRSEAKWLLALLLLHRSELSYPWLQEQLWPSLESAILQDKSSSIRGAVLALKQALGEVFLPTQSGVVALKLEMFDVMDLYAFDDLIARGDDDSLKKAVALYKGDFLEDCSHEWAKLPREMRSRTLIRLYYH